MEINTKYNIGDKLYILDNHIIKEFIVKKIHVYLFGEYNKENCDNDKMVVNTSYSDYDYDEGGENEEDLFETKEKLKQYLLKK